MRAAILAVAAAALLMGCATAHRAALVESARADCLSFGIAPDSPDLAGCIERRVSADEARRAAAAGILLRNSARPAPVTCTTIGQQTTCR